MSLFLEVPTYYEENAVVTESLAHRPRSNSKAATELSPLG